jgi:hypothetical protein
MKVLSQHLQEWQKKNNKNIRSDQKVSKLTFEPETSNVQLS